LNQYKNKKCRVQKTGVDQYGRTLGVLWVDSVNINLLLVEEGLAWHFKKYSKDKVLADAVIRARNAKKGLWNDSTAVAPWEWRKRKN
jgi:endonuclease YncB( thermonuclease family)